MNKSELPFLRSSFSLRVFYLVLTSNNVFTHEIIVSIASLYCKIYFQLFIKYLLIWTQRKKRRKAQNVRFLCKIKPLTFYYSKKRKIRWMVLLQSLLIHFLFWSSTKPTKDVLLNSWLRMRKTKHMNWAMCLVTISQFLPKTTPTFFLFNSKKHLFFLSWFAI